MPTKNVQPVVIHYCSSYEYQILLWFLYKFFGNLMVLFNEQVFFEVKNTTRLEFNSRELLDKNVSPEVQDHSDHWNSYFRWRRTIELHIEIWVPSIESSYSCEKLKLLQSSYGAFRYELASLIWKFSSQLQSQIK